MFYLILNILFLWFNFIEISIISKIFLKLTLSLIASKLFLTPILFYPYINSKILLQKNIKCFNCKSNFNLFYLEL